MKHKILSSVLAILFLLPVPPVEAQLGPLALAALRRQLAARKSEIGYDKATVNAALQAIHTFLQNNKAQISADINAATTPFVFTAQDKKLLVAFYMAQQAQKDSQ